MWTEEGGTGRNEVSLARLKPGVSYGEALAELAALAGRLAQEHPVDRGVGATLEPLADTRAGPVRPLLWTLCGAVAMILLIACANLASLLLAKNSARSKRAGPEVGARGGGGEGCCGSCSSRGAGARPGRRARRARRGLGGRPRVPASLAFVPDLPYTSPSNALPQFWPGGLDVRVLAFAMAVAFATAILFGLAPAFTGSRVSLTDTLKEGGRTGEAGAGRQRLRRLLAIAEVGFLADPRLRRGPPGADGRAPPAPRSRVPRRSPPSRTSFPSARALPGPGGDLPVLRRPRRAGPEDSPAWSTPA